MNKTRRPIFLALLHYIGLAALLFVVFVGFNFLSGGNMLLSIALAVVSAAIVEILSYNMRKQKHNRNVGKAGSAGLMTLRIVYALVAILLSIPSLQAFSLYLKQYKTAKDTFVQQQNSLQKDRENLAIAIQEHKIFLLNAHLKDYPTVSFPRVVTEDDIKSHPNGAEIIQIVEEELQPAQDALDRVDILNQPEDGKEPISQKMETIMNNPFPFFFTHYTIFINEWTAVYLASVETMTGVLPTFTPKSRPDAIVLDTGHLYWHKMAWGETLFFLLLVHVLILWEVFNITTRKRGTISGGRLSDGIVTLNQ